MRALLLVTVLLWSGFAAAQDFEIVSIDVLEPAAGVAELAVTIQNNRRTASHYSVLAQLPGAATFPLLSSTERLESGERTTVTLRFDPTGYARPFEGTVIVRNHRRAEMDRQSFALEPRAVDDAPSNVPVFVTGPVEIAMEIPPIQEAEVSEATVRLTMGADGRERGSILFLRLFDVDGERLTTDNGVVAGSAVLSDRDADPWSSGSTVTLTVPLLEPTAPSQIDRAELSLAPPYQLIGRDVMEVAAFEIEAGGRVLKRVEGPPFHRFAFGGLERTIQIRPPLPLREVNYVKVVLHTGNDDKRAQSHVRFQALDRAGQPLQEEPFENLILTRDQIAGGSSRSVGWYIRRLPANEIGSIVIEHESVQTGPFDTADNWTLAGVDVLFYTGSSPEPETKRISYTAMGAPLHRFDGDHRRFVLRLP